MNSIIKKFEQMGARVKIIEKTPDLIRFSETNPTTGERKRYSAPSPVPDTTFRIDVKKDSRGSYFEITKGNGVDMSILDIDHKDRHLLLLARHPQIPSRKFLNQEIIGAKATKMKFLAGHDETDWFVAAVPEQSSVTGVDTAKQALKPNLVLQAETSEGLKTKDRHRRHNAAWLRQGEFFFLPRPDMNHPKNLIFYNEPLQRGNGSKPHMCSEIYREGGEVVYVSPRNPNGITQKEFNRLKDSERKNFGWRVMVRNARVYARGRVSHPDHKTLKLPIWHLVEMNTESKSKAMRNVAFLD